MTFRLTEQELQKLDKNGFIGPFDLYNREDVGKELKRLRLSLLDRSNAPYDQEPAGNIGNYDRHLDIPFLAEHVKRPEIVGRVASILGEDLLCWRTEFFAKYPGDEGTDWHQSRSVAIGSGSPPVAATQSHDRYPDVYLTLSVWTALTDATIMPGSQKELHYDDQKLMTWRAEAVNNTVKGGVKRGLFGYDTREIQIDEKWAPDETQAFNMELAAGQFVMFWEATMHGSLPNRTKNQTRMAVVARYVPTHVQIYRDFSVLKEYGGEADLRRWHAVLVSGTDKYGYNKLSLE